MPRTTAASTTAARAPGRSWVRASDGREGWAAGGMSLTRLDRDARCAVESGGSVADGSSAALRIRPGAVHEVRTEHLHLGRTSVRHTSTCCRVWRAGSTASRCRFRIPRRSRWTLRPAALLRRLARTAWPTCLRRLEPRFGRRRTPARTRSRCRVHQRSPRSWCHRSSLGRCTHRRVPDRTGRTSEDGRDRQAAAPGGVVEAAGIEVGIEPLNRFETYFLNTAADAARLYQEIQPACGHPRRHLPRQHRGEVDWRGAATRGSAPRAPARLRERPRHPRLGARGLGRVLQHRCCLLRPLDDDRELRFFAGRLSAGAVVWRDLAPTPDAIAFEGVTFLRAHAAG